MVKQTPDIPGKNFHLTKWFLDYAGDDGSMLIAYAARLTWRGISVPYSNLIWHAPDGAVHHKSRFTRAHLPISEGASIRWEHPGFRASGLWESAADPLEARLFDSDGKYLNWHCLQPLSRVQLSLQGQAYSGMGYAEVLTMNFPAWEIPMAELRWGHVVLPGHWGVWIDIRGGYNRTWAWWNGVPVSDCEISDTQLHLPGKGVTLLLERKAQLGEGQKIQKVVSNLVRYIPGFQKIIPEPFLHADEQKWCSKATLQGASDTPVQGWAIHELVNFTPTDHGSQGRKHL